MSAALPSLLGRTRRRFSIDDTLHFQRRGSGIHAPSRLDSFRRSTKCLSHRFLVQNEKRSYWTNWNRRFRIIRNLSQNQRKNQEPYASEGLTTILSGEMETKIEMTNRWVATRFYWVAKLEPLWSSWNERKLEGERGRSGYFHWNETWRGIYMCSLLNEGLWLDTSKMETN